MIFANLSQLCYFLYMSTEYTLLEQTLQKHGYSITTPRRLVFEVLNESEPQDIATIARQLQGKLNRATIYRTISLFEKLSIVQRLQLGWKYKLELSDSFHHHHHHFSCQNCGEIFALHEDERLEKQISELATSLGFEPLSHQLEISGNCKNCRKTVQ